MATVGLAIASYLALFQYRVVDTVWEPFFGNGSRRVLTSELSNVLPVSDAALGACGYLVDVVAGLVGGRARWRTMPWHVIIFGVAVGPLGLTSVLFVIAQPLLYDAFFVPLCLASAVVSLVLIGLAFDEVLASLQQIQRVRRAGGFRLARVLGSVPSWRVVAGPARRGRDLTDGLAGRPALRRHGATSDRAASPILAATALVAMNQGVSRRALAQPRDGSLAPGPPSSSRSARRGGQQLRGGARGLLIAPDGRPDRNPCGGG